MVATLSVIIPAFNEAGNLEGTVEGVLSAVGQKIGDFEVIIVDDASSDATGKIAEKLARGNPKIRVIRHEKNSGFGASFLTGFKASRFDYVGFIPGDNEIVHDSIKNIFQHVGEADIVVPYGARQKVRPWLRRKISNCLTFFLNLLFGLNVKYYNGPAVYKKSVLEKIPIDTKSFGFMTANLVRILKKGHSFVEVEFRRQPRLYGTAQAFRLKNITGTLKTILKLFWEVRVKK